MNFKCEFCEIALTSDLDVSKHLVSQTHHDNVAKARELHPLETGKGKEMPRNIMKLFESLKLRTKDDVRDLADRGYFRLPPEETKTVNVIVKINNILAKNIAGNLSRNLEPAVRQVVLDSFDSPIKEEPPEKQQLTSVETPKTSSNQTAPQAQSQISQASRLSNPQSTTALQSTANCANKAGTSQVTPSPSSRSLIQPRPDNVQAAPRQKPSTPQTSKEDVPQAQPNRQIVPNRVVKPNIQHAVSRPTQTNPSAPSLSTQRQQVNSRTSQATQGPTLLVNQSLRPNLPQTASERQPVANQPSKSNAAQGATKNQQVDARASRPNVPPAVVAARSQQVTPQVSRPRIQTQAQVPTHSRPQPTTAAAATSATVAVTAAVVSSTPIIGTSSMPRPLLDDQPPQPRPDSTYRPLLAKIKIEPKDKD